MGNVSQYVGRAFWKVVGVSIMAVTSACTSQQTGSDETEPLGTVRQQYSCSVASDPNMTYVYVAPDGDDDCTGLGCGQCNSPFKTLRAAEHWIRDVEEIEMDEHSYPMKLAEKSSYTVYVRGGTYYETKYRPYGTDWKVGPDSNHSIKILAYPTARPIFDGNRLVANAFRLLIGQGVMTDVQISGLTWRHYQNGLSIKGHYDRDDPTAEVWTGGAVVSDNVFEEIGDDYFDECAEWLKSHDNCLAAHMIGLTDARHNTVEHNVMVRGASEDSAVSTRGNSRALMHALYITNAHDNTVIDNYIALVSGDPIRFRDRSSCNQIYRNYITDSGQKSFASCWTDSRQNETDCGTQNLVDDPATGGSKSCGPNVLGGEGTVLVHGIPVPLELGNAMTFGYPWVESDSSRCKDPMLVQMTDFGGGTGIVDAGNLVFRGQRPKVERIGGLTAGDYDGDKWDAVIALNYDDIGFTKIVATDAGNAHFSRLLSVGSWRVDGLASGQFSGTSKSLVAYKRSGSVSRLWRGTGEGSLTSTNDPAKNLGKVWDDDSGWIVNEMTSGDFDGSGEDQLLCAMSCRGGSSG